MQFGMPCSEPWRSPTRREIFRLLRAAPRTSGEIARSSTRAGRPYRRHLGVLKDAGLVTAERDGQEIRYELNTSVFQDLVEHLMEWVKPNGRHADSRPLVTITALYIISVAAYIQLPPATVDRAFIAFLLPTAAAAIYTLMRLLAAHDHVPPRQWRVCPHLRRHRLSCRPFHRRAPRHHPRRSARSRRRRAQRPLVPRLAPILLGAGLIAIGNLLPQVRPNVAIDSHVSHA